MSQTLLLPRWLLTMKAGEVTLEDHALLIDGERIAAIGPRAELLAQYPQAERVELPEQILIPGLINGHAHSAMTLLRGVADDVPLMDWLQNHIWPLEKKWVSEEWTYLGSKLAAAEGVHAPRFAFSREALQRFAAGGMLAHLVLVPNPEHNPKGDFGLRDDGVVLSQAEVRHTYSTIALLRKALGDSLPYGNPQGVKAALAPLLRTAMERQLVTGELYTGPWADIGTPARLAAINAAPDSAATAAD